MRFRLRMSLMALLLLAPTLVQAAKTPEAKADLQATLEASERRAFDAFMKHDSTAFFKAMDMNALGVDPTGVMQAASIVATMKDYAITNYTLSDFHLMSLDSDVAAIIYTARVTGTYKGQPMPDVPVYVTTVYKRHGNTWIGMLHQESPAMPPMASAPATSH